LAVCENWIFSFIDKEEIRLKQTAEAGSSTPAPPPSSANDQNLVINATRVIN